MARRKRAAPERSLEALYLKTRLRMPLALKAALAGARSPRGGLRFEKIVEKQNTEVGRDRRPMKPSTPIYQVERTEKTVAIVDTGIACIPEIVSGMRRFYAVTGDGMFAWVAIAECNDFVACGGELQDLGDLGWLHTFFNLAITALIQQARLKVDGRQDRLTYIAASVGLGERGHDSTWPCSPQDLIELCRMAKWPDDLPWLPGWTAKKMQTAKGSWVSTECLTRSEADISKLVARHLRALAGL